MLPPPKKRNSVDPVSITATPTTASHDEKATLAQHLHAQGINPLRWTEAPPATAADQATYRETGRKPRDNQFDVAGRLYDWVPAVMATPRQARAIADAYVAAQRNAAQGWRSPAIEQLIDVERVQLAYPETVSGMRRAANDVAVRTDSGSLHNDAGAFADGLSSRSVQAPPAQDALALKQSAAATHEARRHPADAKRSEDGDDVSPQTYPDDVQGEVDRFKRERERLQQNPSPPIVSDGDGRAQCIRNNGGCLFEISDDAAASDGTPWFELGGSTAVLEHSEVIENVAKEYRLDPDLIRAVMYMETTHGYYDKPLAWIDKNNSILPMNVNVTYWGPFLGTRADLKEPLQNIRAGAKMLRAIINNLPANAPIAHVASLYQNHRADKVSDYGARVARIYNEKLWNKKR